MGKLQGTGNWEECFLDVSKLITESSEPQCYKEKCYLGKVVAPSLSLSSIELYGFSEYWFSLEDVLDLGGTYNFSAVVTKARRFCRQKWANIRVSAVLKTLYALLTFFLFPVWNFQIAFFFLT